MDETTIVEQGGELLRALLLAGLVLLLFIGVGMLVFKLAVPFLLKRLDGSKHRIARILLQGFCKPISTYLKITCFLCVVLVLAVCLPTGSLPAGVANVLGWLPPFIGTTLRVVAIVTVAWGLINSSDITMLVLRGAQDKLDVRVGGSVARFLRAIFNVLVVAVAAAVLLSEFDYDINGLIAGLGLGGLTVALAAQDSAKNFFGGLVIVLEKPFEIGDYITCSDNVGTVEDISLRSTKLRNAEGSLIVVPNSTLAAASITNWSNMKARRASITLRLSYITPKETLEGFAAAIAAMLEADEQVAPGPTVRFTELGTAALELTVLFDTTLTDYAGHLQIKERVNYAIMELARGQNIGFSAPGTAVYMEKAPCETKER